MHSFLKRTAAFLHRIAATRPWLANPYLHLYRGTKHLPDGRWKEFVLNSLSSTSWPELDLRPAWVELDKTKLRLVPHMHEFDFTAHLYRQLPYENEIVRWLAARSYQVVLDIGANVGVYSLFFSKLWPQASIYSFEPSQTVYGRLLHNIQLNGCPNLHSFNCAVGSKMGLIDFYEPEGHLSNGSLDREFASIFADQVVCNKVIILNGCELQSLVQNLHPVLLKVDVEGAEPEVIRSLEPLITSTWPDIVLEVLPRTASELNTIRFLREGYSLYHLTSQGPVSRESFLAGSERDYALVARS